MTEIYWEAYDPSTGLWYGPKYTPNDGQPATFGDLSFRKFAPKIPLNPKKRLLWGKKYCVLARIGWTLVRV